MNHLPNVITDYIIKYGQDIRWGVDVTIDYGNAEINGRQFYFDSLHIVTTSLNLHHLHNNTKNTFITQENQNNFFDSNHKFQLLDGTFFLYQYKNSEFYYIANHINSDYIGKIMEITHQLDPDMIDEMILVQCYSCNLVCIKGVLFNIHDKRSKLFKLYEEESYLLEIRNQIGLKLLPLRIKVSTNIIQTLFNQLFQDSLNKYFSEKVELLKTIHLQSISHNLNFLRISQGLPGLNFNS